jgi:hypothetical protein
MAQWLQPATAVLSQDEEDEGHAGLRWAILASWAETRMDRHG